MVTEKLAFAGDARYKIMFGKYMVYIGGKPLVLVCDNTVFVKMLPCIDGLLSEKGYPYDGAKEHYVLDFEDSELAGKVIRLLDEATPLPKTKQPKKKTEEPGLNDLLANIDKLHTTEMGVQRIARNLGITTNDVVAWCRDKIAHTDVITRQGKNWYTDIGGAVITVNSHSYTIITAHMIKEGGSSKDDI